MDALSNFERTFWRIALNMAGSDGFLAEDLYQEMCVNHLFAKPGQAKSYYEKAARNAAIDYLRSRKENYKEKQDTVSIEAMEIAGIQIDTEGNIYGRMQQAADGQGGDWDDE